MKTNVLQERFVERSKMAMLEQRTAKCEDRLKRVERRQRTQDQDVAVLERLEACERKLGLRSDVGRTRGTDSASDLDVAGSLQKARACAEELAGINKQNRDYWAAEQERERHWKQGA